MDSHSVWNVAWYFLHSLKGAAAYRALHTDPGAVPLAIAPIGFNESRCNEHGVNGVSPWSRFIICFYHDRGNSEAYARTRVPFSSCARRLCWSTAHGFFVFVPPLSLHFRNEYPSGEMFECTYVPRDCFRSFERLERH